MAQGKIMSYTGEVIDLERMETSRNGNPRFRAVFKTDTGENIAVYTGVDSSLGYEIQNFDRPDRRCTFSVSEGKGHLILEDIKRIFT